MASISLIVSDAEVSNLCSDSDLSEDIEDAEAGLDDAGGESTQSCIRSFGHVENRVILLI